MPATPLDPSTLHPSLNAVECTTIERISPDHGLIHLNVAVLGPDDGELILCVHGWPENWYSWRHQMTHFAARGFRVAAMDVRGYGGSSRPDAIEAYRLTELCADAAAVVEALSPGRPAVLFGHDWGAPIVWNTSRLHPEVVRAVAGMSVRYSPSTSGDPMEFWDQVHPDRFFYMRYFQEPGVAEAAFEVDRAAELRKIYYAASGDSPIEAWTAERPIDTAMLDVLEDPDPPPAWMNTIEIEAMLAVHGTGPLHGWFHRYRAQYLDGDDIEPIGRPVLTHPTCFIAGADDIVRHFVPGMDFFADPGGDCGDHRGTTLIDGVGHWVQQEAPEQTNQALTAFLATLSQTSER